MIIKNSTTLEQLWQLRRKFSPRWGSESAKVRAARENLTGDELEKAKQEYRDFETVATSVIVLTDLRQEFEELKVKHAKEVAELKEKLALAAVTPPPDLTPEERDRLSQGTYEGPDMTPDSPYSSGGPSAQSLMDTRYDEAGARAEKESAKLVKKAQSVVDLFDAGKERDARHELEHLVPDARVVGSWLQWEQDYLLTEVATELNGYVQAVNEAWEQVQRNDDLSARELLAGIK